MSPPQPWSDGQRWYEYGLDVVFLLVVAWACMSYARRAMAWLAMPEESRPAWNPRWRDRIEWRVVLYAFAVVTVADPMVLGVIRSLEIAAASPPSGPPRGFWETFVWGRAITAVATAAEIVVIDRRLLARDRERWGRSCRARGYDLRATPDRCPECGTDKATATPAQR